MRLKRYVRSLPWQGFFAATAVVVTGGWLGEAIQGRRMFEGWHLPVSVPQHLSIPIFAALFLASLVWLYQVRHKLLGHRTLAQGPAEPHRALIAFLSPPSLPLAWDGADGSSIPTLKGMPLPSKLAEAIEATDQGKLGIRWNWQQFLRSLRRHRETLESVYLIGSTQSWPFLEDAEKLLHHVLPRNVRVFHPEEAVNFEDVRQLMGEIKSAVRKLRSEDDSLSDRDVVIDVTGGQKSTSVAGAVVTLNSDLKFQYVQTNEPYDVLLYDVVSQHGDMV